MSNVIDLTDQAMFLAERSPLANLLQCVWVYDRAVDMDGLRRFHRQLSGEGCPAASNAPRCRSAAIAG